MKYYEESIRSLENTLVKMKRKKASAKMGMKRKKIRRERNDFEHNKIKKKDSESSFKDIIDAFVEDSEKRKMMVASENRFNDIDKKAKERNDVNLMIPSQLTSKGRNREENQSLIDRASEALRMVEHGSNY